MNINVNRISLIAASFVSLGAACFAQATWPFVPKDQSATVTLTPPSIIEDNKDVAKRNLLTPISVTFTHEPLPIDHRGPVEKLWGWVDIRDNYNGDPDVGIEGGIGWNSLSAGNIFPPDNTMAVGPNNIIAATNSGMRFYSKAGAQQFNTSWGTFFSGIQPGSTFTSDPKVLYDEGSGRWFVLILALKSNLYSYHLIAVSDDSDPNGTWKKYVLDSTLNGAVASGYWSDYPGLGVSPEAIYITGNMFNIATGGFGYVKLRIIPKQQLLDFAASLTYSDIWNIKNADNSIASTIQPANTYGTSQAPFLANVNGSSRINVFGVNNPLGSPTLTVRNLPVTSFGAATTAQQLGGTTRLDTIDTRVYNSVWRNNKIWFGHTISSSGGAGSRWYSVNTGSWPGSISMSNTGTASVASVYQWFPSVAVNTDDTMVMDFSRASTTEFASIYYSYRYATDPANTLTGPISAFAGTHYYTGEGGTPVRWGDYSTTIADPADKNNFWMFNEYCLSVGSTWVTRVQCVGIAAPGAPTTIVADDKTGQITSTVVLTATLTKTSDGSLLGGKTIAFKVAGVSVGSAVTNASGVASLNYVMPEPGGTGNQVIQADFGGDGTCANSTDTANLTVTPANTITTVNPASGMIGQTVALSGNLKRATDNTPLGSRSLSFKVSGNLAGSGGTDGSGNASVNYYIGEGVGVGNKTLDANFNGDAIYIASSDTDVLTVNKATTSLTVPNQAGDFAGSATLTATLKRTTDNANLVGRTVSFKIDGGSVGSGVTNGSGVASYNYTIVVGVGGHTITAEFAGDATHLSTSNTGTLTVNQANTAISVLGVTGQIGETVSLSATLSRSTDGALLSGQTVSFTVDGNGAGSGVTNGSGVASVNYTIPESGGTGAHTIGASFAGDPNHNGSSNTGTLTVNKANTAIFVAGAAGLIGETVSLSALLSRSTDGALLSGQTVSFTVDGNGAGSGVTNGSGVASVSYTIPESGGTGAHTIGASFAGDPNHNGSSNTGTLTVNKAPTDLSVPNQAGSTGGSVNLTATLSRTTDGANLAARSVDFKIDGGLVGSGVTNGSGVASYSYTIVVGAGSHTITAEFAGDSTHLSTSGTGNLDVTNTNATVTGNVELQNLAISPAGFAATIEFRTPSTLTVIYSDTITLDGSGDYSVANVPAGTYDVAVKFSNWLRQVLPSVVVSTPTTAGVNFSLVNGDADDSNSVDVNDLNEIFGNFTLTGDGDIDWDGIVALPDLNIVIVNFAQIGQD